MQQHAGSQKKNQVGFKGIQRLFKIFKILQGYCNQPEGEGMKRGGKKDVGRYCYGFGRMPVHKNLNMWSEEQSKSILLVVLAITAYQPLDSGEAVKQEEETEHAPEREGQGDSTPSGHPWMHHVILTLHPGTTPAISSSGINSFNIISHGAKV